MKAPTTILTLASVLVPVLANPSSQGRAFCDADDCARVAVGLPGDVQSSHLAACASFLSVTLIPPTSTKTVTVVETVSPFISILATDPALAIETSSISSSTTTASPTTVPHFASDCTGAARYSSACSCAGISQVTTTAPTPVVTVTSTSLDGVSFIIAPTTAADKNVLVKQFARRDADHASLPCDSIVRPGQGCGCRFLIRCGESGIMAHNLITRPADNEIDCVRLCNSIENCDFANWNRTAGTCDVFSHPPKKTWFRWLRKILRTEFRDDSVLIQPRRCSRPGDGVCHPIPEF